MKRLILFAPAIALAGLAAGCSKGADQLQPGQWEMAVQLKSLEMPGAPPEAVAQIRSALSQAQPNRDCLTPEQARNPLAEMRQLVAQGRAANCRFTDEVFGGGVIRIRATCQGPGGQGSGGTVSMEGSFTATTLQATLNAQGANPGVPGATMNMTAEVTGRRIGDCAAGTRPGNGL
jgi:uncharacterized protein DUF3617